MVEKNKHQRYTKEVKLEAIHRVLEGNEPVQSVIKDLGIRHRDNVYVWIKKYKQEGNTAFDRRIGRKSKKEDHLSQDICKLKAEVAALKKYLQILHQGGLKNAIEQ